MRYFDDATIGGSTLSVEIDLVRIILVLSAIYHYVNQFISEIVCTSSNVFEDEVTELLAVFPGAESYQLTIYDCFSCPSVKPAADEDFMLHKNDLAECLRED